MIKVKLYKTKTGGIYGFSVDSHGSDIVCAAVSILVQNTINSIERFTGDNFICEYNKSGGHLFFEHPSLKKDGNSHDSSLLLNAMALGLYGIQSEYKNDITITEEVNK